MAEFFDMGGYALFVWSSFGLAAATMGFNIISARRRMRITLAQLAARAARQQVRMKQSGNKVS
jgi:heme exporter protein D